MSQMGQGIADAYANVGRIEGQGYAAMGEGIAKGITAIGGAVADYKKMSSQVKSSENFYKTMKEGGYLPPEMTKGIDTMVGGDVYKNMGTAEKAQFWGDVRAYNAAALGQYHKMQQIRAEQKGLYDRAVATKKPSLNMGSADKAIYDVLNFQDDGFGSPSGQSQPNVQDSTAGATGLAEFLRKRGWSGRGPVPQALMDEYNASIGR
jgi:hypothetical protein